MKKFKKYKFKTFKALENFFETKILPYKNNRSKVIGKTIYVWEKTKKGAAMGKTYQVVYLSDLEKLNKKSISMGRNQNIPVEKIAEMKKDGKFVAIVSFAFPHNEVEQRLVLFVGKKYGSLLLDVSFDDYKKYVKKLTLPKEAA